MELKEAIMTSIISFIPKSIKNRIVTRSKDSIIEIFSQEGEDRLLERFIGPKNHGIYIDVGAHHPSFISNTYYFYKKGWRGINVDAIPGSMDLFNTLRPLDINIEEAISDEDGESIFYIFNTPELNTFDETKVKEFLKFPNVKLVNEMTLRTRKLGDILDDFFPRLGVKEIDFLSVDVEGFDLKVLKSNNWAKYRPNYVLAEDLFCDILKSHASDLNKYMVTVGYTMKAKTYNTILFQKND